MDPMLAQDRQIKLSEVLTEMAKIIDVDDLKSFLDKDVLSESDGNEMQGR